MPLSEPYALPAGASASLPAQVSDSLSAWRIGLGPALAWAIGLGVLISTEFISQTYVWTYWPWNEVLVGWIGYAGERVLVAVAIALSIVAASRLPGRSLAWRSACLAAAIVLGAVAGESALLAVGASGAQTDTSTMLRGIAHWSGVAAGLALIFYLWHRSTEARAAAQTAQVRQLQAERQIAQARLQALRSQIEPHFLFNTLATVRRLHQTGPVQGTQLLHHFLGYLRSSLPPDRQRVATLGDEIDLVRAYLSVLEVRMSGLLRVQFEVPKDLRDCDFPPLTLATLVENAIKHGIGPSASGGTILVKASTVGALLEVQVADTGIGFASAGPGGAGIGLANIRARLATLYGARGRLTLKSNQPRGVCSIISIPFAPAQNAAGPLA
jgi:hypothetical protein